MASVPQTTGSEQMWREHSLRSLSASATRAGLHQALASRGNLADVTGKAGSQSIAAR